MTDGDAKPVSIRDELHQMLTRHSDSEEPQSAADFLQAVATAQQIDHEARNLLQHSILTAREAGATWSDIGKKLGISKQAAQKRFAAPEKLPALELDPQERVLGPVTMMEEISELNLAGRYGWHSVDFGIAHHKVVHSEHQWEHCRVTGTKKIIKLQEQGWIAVGKSFPYTFLKRDTGKPALPEPGAD